MSLPPVFYHHFRTPLPYAKTLVLQEKLHQIQLAARRTSSHQDLLLLLQHRPVYTAGRRQTGDELAQERTRVVQTGADFVATARGGQLTYHGPGQLVGYPPRPRSDVPSHGHQRLRMQDATDTPSVSGG